MINDINELPKCKCSNYLKFNGFYKGFSNFCNRSCEYSKKQRIENTRNTHYQRYGCYTPMECSSGKDAYRKSLNLENIKLGKEKRIKTNLIKTGFVSNFQTLDFKEKSKLTSILKYGVEHPMQSDIVFEKNSKSRKKFKEFVLPSGKIIKLQGYEHIVLRELLKKYEEDDILTSVQEIHNYLGFFIIYKDLNNKTRKYYPDFYIKSENKIIEVKSSWTSKVDEHLKLKEEICIKLNLNFQLIIPYA